MRFKSFYLVFLLPFLFFFASCAEESSLVDHNYSLKNYLTGITISPDPSLNFDPGIFIYNVEGMASTFDMTITGVEGQVLRVNGVTVTSGIATNITVGEGTTVFTVEVSGLDRQPTTYTINYYFYQPEKDATLSALSVAEGSISPEFDKSKTNYSMSFVGSVGSVSITATPNITGADLYINGSSATAGVPTAVSVAGGVTNIPVMVVSTNGQITNTYHVSVTFVPLGGMYVSAFCPDSASSQADGGAVWMDVTIADVTKIPPDWTIFVGTYRYLNVVMTSSEKPGGWNFSNGDVIRVHGNSWTGVTDSVIGDNNASIWDFKTSSAYHLDYKYGIAGVKSGQYTISIVTYDCTANNPSGYWLDADSAPDLALDSAVSLGLWPSDDRADAFTFAASTSVYVRLTNSAAPGSSSGYWETAP